MNRKPRKTASSANADGHFETLGRLLTQLETHLTESAGAKGTYGDYLRLLEVYRAGSDQHVNEIIISWVDNENSAEPLP